MLFKKYYILIFVLFIPIVFFAQTDTLINKVKYSYISRYSNGKVYQLGNFSVPAKNQIKNGAWLVYDGTGAIIEEGVYKKNKKNRFLGRRWSNRLL